MATDKHPSSDIGKLERMLEGIQKKASEIAGIVRATYDNVAEIAETTDSIYDLVSYHRESSVYDVNHDDFLNDPDD